MEKTSWDKIGPQVSSTNPKLFEIIENLSPGPEYTLYKLSLPFGCKYVDRGKLLLPDDSGNLLPLDDTSIDSNVREDLDYNLNSNPLSLILKGSFEIFFTMEHHTIPFAMASKGDVMSTGIALDSEYNHQPAFLWNISAGARSLFMLPKISVASKLKKLQKELGFESDVPSNLLDHGTVFQKIANSQNIKSNWHAEILFFGKKWFESLEDKAWMEFSHFLHKKAWRGYSFWRSEFIWNLIFSFIQKEKNLKPNPYIADTTKHLLSMAVGAYPGFSPAINDDVGPISCIQKVFAEIYQLNNYPPIIMQPHYFSTDTHDRDVYYSLEYPTTFCFSPKARRLSNKIVDLIDIKYLLKRYIDMINSGNLNLEGTPLSNLDTRMTYSYYHSDARLSDNINCSKLIFQEDPNFKKASKKYWESDMSFPEKSPFLNGCIRLSKK